MAPAGIALVISAQSHPVPRERMEFRVSSSHARNGSGRIRIEYSYRGRRHSLSPGLLSEDERERFRSNLKRLIKSKKAGFSPEAEIESWTSNLSDAIYDNLASAGLVPPLARGITLSRLIERMRKERPVSPAAEAARSQAHRALIEAFGADTRVDSITEADCLRWWKRGVWASKGGKELAMATKEKRRKDAKAVFNFAIEAGVIRSNPMKKIRKMSQANPRRQRYIAWHEVEELRGHMTSELFAMIATVRLAGLRCPSEINKLTWGDVDFARQQLTISQSKLDCGGEKDPYRKCPMRHTLAEVLRGIRPSDWTQDMYVFPRVEGSPCGNPRGHLLSASGRAGIKMWVKPFANLRASAVTDFRASGISRVQVGRWTGNSEGIGDLHYDLPFQDQFLCAVNLPIAGSPPSEAA